MTMKIIGGLLTAILLLGATYAYADDNGGCPKGSHPTQGSCDWPTPHIERPAKEDELPYVDEACAESFSCQGTIIYELIIVPSEQVLSVGDMDKEQCEALKEAAEGIADAEPFTALRCRPRMVERTEL